MRAIKDVVAESERNTIVADEFTANHERLHQTLRLRLRRVLDRNTDARAITKKAPESVLFVRCRNHQDTTNPRKHQRRQRVVHHRLAVDREQLLADAKRQWMQSR